MARKVKGPPADPVARRLYFSRLALGYPEQKGFALNAGIQPQSYNTSETGKRPLPATQAFALNDKYGLTPDWLYFAKTDHLPYGLVKKLQQLGAFDAPLTGNGTEGPPRIVRLK